MKILVLTSLFPAVSDRSEGTFILDSVQSIRDEGHDVHVIHYQSLLRMLSTLRIGLNAKSSSDSLPLHRAYYLSIPRYYLYFLSRLSCLISVLFYYTFNMKLQRFDAVISHQESGADIAYLIATLNRAPSIAFVHGEEQSERYHNGLLQRIYLKTIFNLPDRLILVGNPLKAYVDKYLTDPNKRLVIHNGHRIYEQLPNRHRQILSKSDIRLLSVSNLVPSKGVQNTISALARLISLGFSNASLDIVGSGVYMENLQKAVASYNLSSYVTFHGQLSNQSVHELMLECDIFILPSNPEAFGIAYVEAMSNGLLTIGVDKQGPSEFIEDNKTGFLLQSNEPHDIVKCLRYVLTNKARCRQIAIAGTDYVKKSLTWKSHGQKVIKVLDSLSGTTLRGSKLSSP